MLSTSCHQGSGAVNQGEFCYAARLQISGVAMRLASFKFLLMLIALISMFGCGQKGDLYLPDEEPSTYRSTIR
jgi:hypothetical protein